MNVILARIDHIKIRLKVFKIPWVKNGVESITVQIIKFQVVISNAHNSS